MLHHFDILSFLTFNLFFPLSGTNELPYHVSRWERRLKKTKARNFIYNFNILFSYLHFVPPFYFFYSHLEIKTAPKYSKHSQENQKYSRLSSHISFISSQADVTAAWESTSHQVTGIMSGWDNTGEIHFETKDSGNSRLWTFAVNLEENGLYARNISLQT